MIATGGIGMIGYYSRVPVLDRLGLTEPGVAHMEIEKRGRPGHEKVADQDYVRERGAVFVRGGAYPKWFRTHGRIVWGPKVGGRPWRILRYDRELMQHIREVAPEVRFEDFEYYLDRYIVAMPRKRPKEVRKRYRFFKSYYFDHNADPVRREAFETYLAWVRDKRDPAQLYSDERWRAHRERYQAARKRKLDLAREQRTLRRSAPLKLDPAPSKAQPKRDGPGATDPAPPDPAPPDPAPPDPAPPDKNAAQPAKDR